MNGWFVVAGLIGVSGALAHSVLGHRWTIAPLRSTQVATPQFAGETNRRFLVWFWHIGSVVLLSTTATVLAEGLDLVDVDRSLLWAISALWLAITAVGLVVGSLPPSQLTKMAPVLVGVPINGLILLGLLL